jgi:hypothetical protein
MNRESEKGMSIMEGVLGMTLIWSLLLVIATVFRQ